MATIKYTVTEIGKKLEPWQEKLEEIENFQLNDDIPPFFHPAMYRRILDNSGYIGLDNFIDSVTRGYYVLVEVYESTYKRYIKEASRENQSAYNLDLLYELYVGEVKTLKHLHRDSTRVMLKRVFHNIMERHDYLSILEKLFEDLHYDQKIQQIDVFYRNKICSSRIKIKYETKKV